MGDLLFCVYLGSNAAPDAVRVTTKARRVRALGAASLDLCLVARGAADLYYMHSATMETKLRAVDIAGGTLIVREAGGLVLDLEGHDLDMPLTTTARTDLVAVGDRRTWEAIS
jgi:fructose-1,6-bisphosphatase/inositol monophosphatase family enzyme